MSIDHNWLWDANYAIKYPPKWHCYVAVGNCGQDECHDAEVHHA